MLCEKIKLNNREAAGYVIPLGGINLVFVATGKGLVGCGAFDVAALDRYDYPACKVKSKDGSGIKTLEDLLRAEVSQANDACMKCGVNPGMPARAAVEML